MNQEPNRLPPDVRYYRDATFAHLVNMLEHALHLCEYTPTEIREAAMLAAIRHEQWRNHQVHSERLLPPECTCKNHRRPHEPECYYYMKQEEDELRARMNLQAYLNPDPTLKPPFPDEFF
jgi:hypothetical protein